MLIKDSDSLTNILESILKVENYTSSFQDADTFMEDSRSFDAVLMNFIVIGEMVAKLSDDFKNRHFEIEWWKIKGLRNIVAHDYFGVDAEEIWQIIHYKLPALKSFVQLLLKQT